MFETFINKIDELEKSLDLERFTKDSIHKTNYELVAENERLIEEIHKLKELCKKKDEYIENLKLEKEDLENEVDELEDDEEYFINEREKLLKENEELKELINNHKFNYIAVSLDMNYCIPLSATSCYLAGLELMDKCKKKGISAGGFKVFEPNEIL